MTADIITIGGEHYRIIGVDPGILRPEDRGLIRAVKVSRDQFGRWVVCDDDDWLIADRQIVARETGWDLRRIDERRTHKNE